MPILICVMAMIAKSLRSHCTVWWMFNPDCSLTWPPQVIALNLPPEQLQGLHEMFADHKRGDSSDICVNKLRRTLKQGSSISDLEFDKLMEEVGADRVQGIRLEVRAAPSTGRLAIELQSRLQPCLVLNSATDETTLLMRQMISKKNMVSCISCCFVRIEFVYLRLFVDCIAPVDALQDFLAATLNRSKIMQRLDILRKAFQFFDKGNKGKITREELTAALSGSYTCNAPPVN